MISTFTLGEIRYNSKCAFYSYLNVCDKHLNKIKYLKKFKKNKCPTNSVLSIIALITRVVDLRQIKITSINC